MHGLTDCRRIGRHGIEEVKQHPWFQGVDWATLREVPAPHLPKGSKKMKELMAELREVDADSPRFRQLIKSITTNFDEFKENGGMGNSPMPPPAPAAPAQRATSPQSAKMNINTAGPGGVDRSVSSPILRKDKDDAFLGYTYKRKTVSAA